MKAKKVFMIGFYGYFIVELLLFFLLSGCGLSISDPGEINIKINTTIEHKELLSHNWTVYNCSINNYNITPTGTTTTIQQCPQDYLRIESELRETIKDLRGYAYNGWSMANSTLEELNSITWNSSDTVKYGVNASDLESMNRIKTLVSGMEHSFRNVMGR